MIKQIKTQRNSCHILTHSPPLFQALYGVFWATYYRPRVVVVLALFQSVAFMLLFANFYRHAYKASAAKAKAAAAAAGKKGKKRA